LFGQENLYKSNILHNEGSERPAQAVQQGRAIGTLGGFQHLAGDLPEQLNVSCSSFEEGDRSEVFGGPFQSTLFCHSEKGPSTDTLYIHGFLGLFFKLH